MFVLFYIQKVGLDYSQIIEKCRLWTSLLADNQTEAWVLSRCSAAAVVTSVRTEGLDAHRWFHTAFRQSHFYWIINVLIPCWGRSSRLIIWSTSSVEVCVYERIQCHDGRSVLETSEANSLDSCILIQTEAVTWVLSFLSYKLTFSYRRGLRLHPWTDGVKDSEVVRADSGSALFSGDLNQTYHAALHM